MPDDPKPKKILSLKKKYTVTNSENTSITRPRFALGLKKTPERSLETRRDPPRKPFQERPLKVETQVPQTKQPDIEGKVEVVLKMNQLPNWVHQIEKGQHKFHINGGGFLFEVRVRTKTWRKLLQAQQDYPAWTAAVTGQLGVRIKDGFRLMNASIQIYERKMKSPEDEIGK